MGRSVMRRPAPSIVPLFATERIGAATVRQRQSKRYNDNGVDYRIVYLPAGFSLPDGATCIGEDGDSGTFAIIRD